MIFVEIHEFEADMITFLELVKGGEIVGLVDHGVEVACLVPPEFTQVGAQQALEGLRKTAVIGDALTPIDTKWSAGS